MAAQHAEQGPTCQEHMMSDGRDAAMWQVKAALLSGSAHTSQAGLTKIWSLGLGFTLNYPKCNPKDFHGPQHPWWVQLHQLTLTFQLLKLYAWV